MKELTDYSTAYFETALWAETDSQCEPLDANYNFDDLAPETIERANQDITAFLNEIEKQGLDTSDHDSGQIMHDFWLTRNGHGAGFWDGDYEKELGEKLTAICKKIGSIYIYVGDDNKIYFM